MSRHQTTGQNNHIKASNKYFENVTDFKYLKTTVTNKNWKREEIKRRLNSGNTCYHTGYHLLTSRLPSKNVKIKIVKTIMFPLFCTGVKLHLSH
jgi:hypothetical protein